MKTKLIKDHADYHLVDDKQFIIGTTDKRMLSCTDKHKLSIKNCQAIERGYDLDELSENHAEEVYSREDYEPHHFENRKKNFEDGFQKALELMGDKKFSEEDIKKMMKSASYGWFEADFDKHLATLQQDIWDVEIIEECLDKDCNGVDRKGDCITTGKPKLDAEGCLILKRI